MEHSASAVHQHVYERQRKGDHKILAQVAGALFLNSTDQHAASPDNPREKQLIDDVIELCAARKIRNIPFMVVITSPIPNAASMAGHTLLFSSNIMQIMDRNQLRAIIGHELSHHRHVGRDFIVRGGLFFGGSMAAQVALDFFARISRPVSALLHSGLTSRFTQHITSFWGGMAASTPYQLSMEYEADREGAELVGAKHMAGALKGLEKRVEEMHQHKDEQPSNWVRKVVLKALNPFPTHPSTEQRVNRLRAMENHVAMVHETGESQISR